MEGKERATALAHFFESVQSIPDDIQHCLLTIAQFGCHPDQVRNWYIIVRNHFGAEGMGAGGPPMDSNIVLPRTTSTPAPTTSVSVGDVSKQLGPIVIPVTTGISLEPIPTPRRQFDFWNHPHGQPTPMQDDSLQFISPVSARSRSGSVYGEVATHFPGHTGTLQPAMMATPPHTGPPTRDMQMMLSPRMDTRHGKATAQSYEYPTGLGITQAPSPSQYTFQMSKTSMPLLIPATAVADTFPGVNISPSSSSMGPSPVIAQKRSHGNRSAQPERKRRRKPSKAVQRQTDEMRQSVSGASNSPQSGHWQQPLNAQPTLSRLSSESIPRSQWGEATVRAGMQAFTAPFPFDEPLSMLDPSTPDPRLPSVSAPHSDQSGWPQHPSYDTPDYSRSM